MARRRPSQLVAALVASVACAGAVAACGGDAGPGVRTAGAGEHAAGPASSAAPATGGGVATTDPGPITWPLLGTVSPDGAARQRAAVVVKVDNDPHARPQSGLEAADLVYELEVEGITRFAVVFNAGDAETVGPIRSARSSDIDLLGNLGRPLFAWSGANPTVAGEVGGAASAGVLVNVNQDLAPGDYWRDTSRVAPYNLYSNTVALRALAPSDQGPPDAVFEYLDDGDDLGVGTVPVAGIQVRYPGDGRIQEVVFVWDPARGAWPRFQVDLQHPEWDSAFTAASGALVAPTNVVVLETSYTESAAGGGSPQALTVGTGAATVLVDGQALAGTWRRAGAGDPFTLESSAGEPMRLRPGPTWVLLPEPGHTSWLAAERAAALLAQVPATAASTG